jgi:tetratricopeptide (TPR) repeat protein
MTKIAQLIAYDDENEEQSQPVVHGDGPHAAEVIEGPNQGMCMRFTTSLLIGRADRCDLVIKAGGIAQEHTRIEMRYGRWTAVNLNPEMRTLKNGAPIQVSGVADGDVLTIGPSRLRLAFDEAGNDPCDTTPTSWFGRKKRLLVASVGLFVLVTLAVLLAAYSTSRESRLQTEWAKELVADNTKDMCRLSSLLFQARHLADTGNYEEAKERLHNILRLECGNEEAQRLLESIEDKEKNRAELIRQRELRTALTREAVQPHLRDAEHRMSVGDMAGARAALGAALAIDPNLPEANGILSDIEIRKKALRQASEGKVDNARQRQEELRALQKEAAANLKSGAQFKALLAYRRIAELETYPARQAEVRRKIESIQASLTERVTADLALAQRLIEQKQPVEAYRILSKIVALYPEAKDAQTKLETLRPRIEAEVKRLYEEGVVSAAQGDQATAQARFRAAIALLPKSDNIYAQLAAQKLQPAVSTASKAP